MRGHSGLGQSKAGNDCSRAVVDCTAGPETPVEVVTLAGVIHRSIAFIAVTHATATTRLTTAIVVRNDVLLAIVWIETGTNPGHRRLLSARRTGVGSSTAATA